MLAYITTTYPAPSHRFILREVEALRRRGWDVSTAAIRHGDVGTEASEDERRALRTTYRLRPPPWGDVVRAHLLAMLRHPLAWASTLRVSLGMGRPGVRGRLWQLFYLAEAVVMWRYWTANGARHVHAHHGAVSCDVALLATEFARRADEGPATWSFTLHGPVELMDMRWFCMRRKVEHADLVICISDYARSQLMAIVDQRHWSKLRMLHSGIPVDLYGAVAPPADGPLRILCVGRLVPVKAHSLLIEATRILVDRGHDVTLELVGDGPMRRKLEGLAQRLGLESRVLFAGVIPEEEILRCHAASHIFCLASLAEGVPGVLQEAMAAGRPVVGTAVAGVRELVRDGETGLLVPPGRVDELAAAIERLIEAPELRARLGTAARAYVRRHYDLESLADSLDLLFAELVGIGAVPTTPVEVRERAQVPG